MITPRFLSLATFIALALQMSHGAAAMSEHSAIKDNPLAGLGAGMLGHGDSHLLNGVLSSTSQTTSGDTKQKPASGNIIQSLISTMIPQKQTSSTSNSATSPLASMLQFVSGDTNQSVDPQVAALYHTTTPQPRWGSSAAFLPSANAIVISGGQTDMHSTLTNETLLLDMSGLQNVQRAMATAQLTPFLKVHHSNQSEPVPALAYAASAVSTSSCPAGTVDTFWMVGGKTEKCKTDVAPMYTYNVELQNTTYYGTWRAMPGKGSGARRTHATAVMPPQGLGNDRSKSMIVLGGDNWDEVCHNNTSPQNSRSPSMDVWSLPEPFGETCRGTLPFGSYLLQHNATAHPLQLRKRLTSLPLADYATVQLPSHVYEGSTDLYEPLVFLGGRDHNNHLVSFHKPWVLDQATGQWDRWVTAGDVPSARVGHSAVRLSDGTVLVYGGYKQDSGDKVRATPTSEMYALNPNVSPAHWSRIHYADPPANGPSPSARAFHSAAVVEDVMVVAFGQQYKSTAYGLEKRSGANINASEPLVLFLETQPTVMQWRWTDKLSAVVSGRVAASFLGVELNYGQGSSDANGDAATPGQGTFVTSQSAPSSSNQGTQSSHKSSNSAQNGNTSQHVDHKPNHPSGQSSGSSSNHASGSYTDSNSSSAMGSHTDSQSSSTMGSHSNSSTGSSHQNSAQSGNASSSSSASSEHNHGLVHGHGKAHKHAAQGSAQGSSTASSIGGAFQNNQVDSYPDMVSVTGHPAAPTGFVSASDGSASKSAGNSAGGSNGANSASGSAGNSSGANSAKNSADSSSGASSVGGVAGAKGQSSKGSDGDSSSKPSGKANGSQSSQGQKDSGSSSSINSDGGWSPPTGSASSIANPTTAAPSPTGAAGMSSSTGSNDSQSSSDAAQASGGSDENNGDNKQNNGQSSNRTEAIAGGVVGAAALAVGAVVGGLYAYRKRRESERMAMLRASGIARDDDHDPESGGAPPVSSLWLQQPMKQMYANPSSADAYAPASNRSYASTRGSNPSSVAESHQYGASPLSASPVGGRAMNTDASRNSVRGPRDNTDRSIPSSLAAGSNPGSSAAAGLGAAAAGGYAAHHFQAPRSAATHNTRSDSSGSHHSYPYLSGRSRLHHDDSAGSNWGLDQDASTESSTSIDTHSDNSSNMEDVKTAIHGDEAQGSGMRTAHSFRFPETRAHSPKPMSFPRPARSQATSSQMHSADEY